ncbi:MAG: hypothetical protein IPL27_15460 [Lewinellaceae bacterium]|nr:hypothetical protein [Lewinellaceae bacterium]
MLIGQLRNDIHFKYDFMRTVVILGIFFIFSTLSFAQSPFKKNAIFGELGGNGLLASINYERQLSSKPGFGVRLGMGFYGVKPTHLTVPAGVNYLIPLKKNNSFLDLGFGLTFSSANVRLVLASDDGAQNKEKNIHVNVIPGIGFRRHTSKNMMWRFGLTPIINDNGVIPFLGFALGKQF